MNKPALKKFATYAREKLTADITYKANLLGITNTDIKQPLPESTNNTQYLDYGGKDPYIITGKQINQRKQLAHKISEKAKLDGYKNAFKNIIEEVAYTWFNRIIAIRYMEVNDFLPDNIRILSSLSRKAEPDIVTTPFETNLSFTIIEKDLITTLKSDNNSDELFKILFIKQCNSLNNILPELFEKIDDYSEILLNISYTDKEGVIAHLVNDISEEDFTNAIQIIGWMYQFYNGAPKEETFANLSKNIKIQKENIPAATQLFTPAWIVKYMVENSLGRIWLDKNKK